MEPRIIWRCPSLDFSTGLKLTNAIGRGPLTEWLDGQQNITDWSLESMTEEQGALSLAALVLSQTGQGQGIAVRLTIRTGRSMEGRSITIEEWRQWQPPFEYGDSKGGLWEG